MHRLLITVLLSLALLSACGSDSTGTSTDSSATEPADAAGSGDVAADVDLCEALTAEQVGEAVGATVTTDVGPPGDGEFSREDPRAFSGSIGVLPFSDTNGGYDGYLSGAKGTLTDAKVTDISGAGDRSFLATGTFGGGENIQGSGGAQVGDDVVTVTLVQSSGLSEPEVVDAGTALLRLAAGAL